MKRNILAGVLALTASLGTSLSYAASPPADVYAGWMKPGPPPLERFVKPLGLTAEQQRKLAPIFAEAQAKAAQDEADKAKTKPLGGDTAATTLLTRDADMRVRLATVLTPEQLMRYEALTASRAPNARTTEAHPAHGHSEMDSPAAPRDSAETVAPPAK